MHFTEDLTENFLDERDEVSCESAELIREGKGRGGEGSMISYVLSPWWMGFCDGCY